MKAFKNSILNIFGVIIPALILLPVMGFFSRKLTVEEFGVFSLCFAVLGYSSLFDAGLSRAVVRLLTIKKQIKLKSSHIMGTASAVVFILGLIATLVLFLASEFLSRILKVSLHNFQDVVFSFQILSLAIIPMLLSLVVTAKLEATENFRLFNILRIINAFFSLAPSVLFAFLSKPMLGAIVGIVIGRYLSFFVSVAFTLPLREIKNFRFDKRTLHELFRFGGWISISNIVSPLMVYFDRFILSATLGANQVAYYSSPAELITKMNIIPVSMARAFFPSLSKINDNQSDQYKKIYKMIFILLLLFSVGSVLFVFSFSDLIIDVWLGEKYVPLSSYILQIMIVGFFFNSLAQLPVLQLQSIGVTKAIAIVHLTELIPYLILLTVALNYYGIIGAAYVWCLRVIVDNIALNSIAYINRKKNNVR